MPQPSDLERLAKPPYLTPQHCTAIARRVIAALGQQIDAPGDLEQRVSASVEVTIRAMVTAGWIVIPPAVHPRE